MHTIHTPAMKNLMHSKDTKAPQGASLSKLFTDPNVQDVENTNENSESVVTVRIQLIE